MYCICILSLSQTKFLATPLKEYYTVIIDWTFTPKKKRLLLHDLDLHHGHDLHHRD